MPYIALQLVGIQVVVAALGIEGQGWMADLPLVIAFVILAAYTYNAGLRAPAMIAVVKDAVIYVTVIAAIIVIPGQLGGFEKIFAAVPPPKLLLLPGQTSTFVTLAFGSSLALMLYPHAMTGLLASSGRGHPAQYGAPPRVLAPARDHRPLRLHGARRARRRRPRVRAWLPAVRRELRRPRALPPLVPLLVRRRRLRGLAIGALVPAAVM